tara:strand:- start:240 stop:686 length:447 start_codon:yes stop_codon:yes gene_type:complete
MPDDQQDSHINRTRNFASNGAYWLWHHQGALFVHRAAFDTLCCVDVPKLPAGASKIVGKTHLPIHDDGVAQQVVSFLLESDIVTCYWHISANISGRLVRQSNGAFTGHFKGSHLYFTNDANEDSLAFKLSIHSDGMIHVTGQAIETLH